MTNKGKLANVEVTRKGTKIVLEIDVNSNLGPSATGKTEIVATTHGAHEIDLGKGKSIFLSLNCYKYPNSR